MDEEIWVQIAYVLNSLLLAHFMKANHPEYCEIYSALFISLVWIYDGK